MTWSSILKVAVMDLSSIFIIFGILFVCTSFYTPVYVSEQCAGLNGFIGMNFVDAV